MGRYDRYGDVLSPARREACGLACESYFEDRRTAFGRYSSREGIRCDCNLRSGARIPGNGRSRRAHGRFRRCGDGYSDPVALRREHAEAFRRGDALVRGGVNRLDAGVLYLNYIERLDACVGFEREAIGPERPNLNGMLIDGPILEERYEAGWNMCAGWLSRDMLRRRSATGGGRISGCPVFKESHLFYTKSDLYSVLFVNKVCEYAGIARKAEEMLFLLSDFSGRFEINFYICNDAL